MNWMNKGVQDNLNSAQWERKCMIGKYRQAHAAGSGNPVGVSEESTGLA